MTDYRDLHRQSPVGRRLRKMYQDIVDEELPDEFIELLCDAALRVELERQRQERRQRPPSDAESAQLAADYRSSRRRQTPIGRGLEQIYGSVLKEDVPQEFIELLCEYAVKREAQEEAADPADKPEPPAEHS